ncbi:hypothetical protein IJ818_02985 [bacterium]|nr:hypothetical protein [bacterium]
MAFDTISKYKRVASGYSTNSTNKTNNINNNGSKLNSGRNAEIATMLMMTETVDIPSYSIAESSSSNNTSDKLKSLEALKSVLEKTRDSIVDIGPGKEIRAKFDEQIKKIEQEIADLVKDADNNLKCKYAMEKTKESLEKTRDSIPDFGPGKDARAKLDEQIKQLEQKIAEL